MSDSPRPGRRASFRSLSPLRAGSGGIALGVVLAALCSPSSLAQSVMIQTTIRDFQASHPDFGLPANPRSHVAGNVALGADSVGDPIFKPGSGFVVGVQWRAESTREIAPHMYLVGTDNLMGLQIVNPPQIGEADDHDDDHSVVDTYDPFAGPYGGTNRFLLPEIPYGASMPPMPVAPNVGPSVGGFTRSGAGNTVISSSFLCDFFEVTASHTLSIQGNVTIVSNGIFNIVDSQVGFAPGATLTVYHAGPALISHSLFNMAPLDHTRFVLNNMGPSDVKIFYGEDDHEEPLIGTYTGPYEDRETGPYMSIVAPAARVILASEEESDFFGALTAQTLIMPGEENGFHVAGALYVAEETCEYEVNDTPGLASAFSNGLISSVGTFTQWFKAIPGVNVASLYNITLTPDGSGALSFSSTDFAPIDGRLFGNEGDVHNRNWTMEFTARFTHTSCMNTFFEYRGDGDVWVFIDGGLVIDLAGAQTDGYQHIDIDRLDLTDGTEHVLKFFYANRGPGAAPFEIRTDLPLRPRTAAVTSMSIFD